MPDQTADGIEQLAQINGEDAAYPSTTAQLFGLSKRELFAAMAMQGMRADSTATGIPEEIAAESVRLADALLRELAK